MYWAADIIQKKHDEEKKDAKELENLKRKFQETSMELEDLKKTLKNTKSCGNKGKIAEKKKNRRQDQIYKVTTTEWFGICC